jgi:hypothetical protein
VKSERTEADVYHLKGPGIELTYRRRDGKLDISGDDHWFGQDDLDARATVEPEMGLHVGATLLESDRGGHRYTLTLLLPEVSWESEASQAPEAVTGVAIVTKSFDNAVGGPPPVLQSYDDVQRLEGTASPAD